MPSQHLAVVTLHNAVPSFSKRIFEFTDAFDKLGTAFIQNFVNFFSNAIRSQGAFYLPVGDGKVGFVDVRDIASVASRVLTEHDGGTRNNGRAYDITGLKALS